jgi:adenylosuccinate lyase
MNAFAANAISPLDGRYAGKLGGLDAYFSEYALVKARVAIEVAHALALDATGLFGTLSAAERERLVVAASQFDAQAFDEVKVIEARTRHDVKACELWLRQRAALEKPNRIHFALTSEDVNNLAYGTCFHAFIREVQLPMLLRLLHMLAGFAREHAARPFPANTHGQPASPTTAGKEIAVFVGRLTRAVEALKCIRIYGKLNGATGNHSAALAALGTYDWGAYEQALVRSLGLVPNDATTQVEDHDSWARWFNETRVANNIVMDLCQDVWMYISRKWFTQRAQKGEVGSSTMPHKINPIHFENAEGNLQIANAQLAFLSDKLCRSRMQRDLSDSTVARTIGVAFAHQVLAIHEVTAGWDRIGLNDAACLAELDSSLELLAEPIQTILRLHTSEDSYAQLLELTRGHALTAEGLAQFVDKLNVDESVKEQLRALRARSYVGDAAATALRIAARAEAVNL